MRINKSQTRFWIIPLFILQLLQYSCKNDININADWKETLVVYGVLSPGVDTQFIRVSKAFQNTADGSLAAANISDSLFADTIIVTLTDKTTGKVYTLVPKFDIYKQAGIFANDKNPIYILEKNYHNYVIEPNHTYVIEAKNPITGYRVFSETKSMSNAIISSPVASNNTFLNMGENFNVALNTGLNSYFYESKMDVFLSEWDIKKPNDTVHRKVRWNYLSNFLTGEPGKAVITKIPRISFLQFLSSVCKVETDTRRVIDSIQLVFYGGNQQFYDFKTINEPSIGIVQKQTEYTNITHGYGLFGGRTEQWIYGIKPHNALVGIIRTNDETKNLNFQF